MRLPEKIEAALNNTGKKWTAENGKRHIKLKLDGKMVGILPKSMRLPEARSLKNTISQINRAARGEKCSSHQI